MGGSAVQGANYITRNREPMPTGSWGQGDMRGMPYNGYGVPSGQQGGGQPPMGDMRGMPYNGYGMPHGANGPASAPTAPPIENPPLPPAGAPSDGPQMPGPSIPPVPVQHIGMTGYGQINQRPMPRFPYITRNTSGF